VSPAIEGEDLMTQPSTEGLDYGHPLEFAYFLSPGQGPATDGDETIVGPPGHWAEVLTHFALDLGFSTFVLVGPPDRSTLTNFIEDVAPEVRERVAERRASAPSPTPTA
jgi:alkanesulfonate monooxygenase SsuD/methylene tetrahydromethanopterin reductase-like flavin-dependent oxidoreductase (luciferase family)